MAYLKKKSMEFLKTFDVPSKNPSEDAQRRWREAVGTLVKNRRRRFRMVPDLDKRSQAETQRRNIQVIHPISLVHRSISLRDMYSHLATRPNQGVLVNLPRLRAWLD
jgi:hypothetical protein